MKKLWLSLGVVLAACGGGADEPEPDAMPAPQRMLSLAEPTRAPFLTNTGTVWLSLIGDPEITFVKVDEARAVLEEGKWKVEAEVPRHACDGTPAPTEVLVARGYDRDGRQLATLEIPAIRDNCPPVITAIASSVRDEREMIPTFDRNGYACFWRAPDQPSFEPHAGDVHAHLYAFANRSPGACDAPPPKEGWIPDNENGVRFRFRVTDDVAIGRLIQARIAGAPSEISLPWAELTPGANATEAEAEVVFRDLRDTSENLLVSATVETTDATGRMATYAVQWTQDTLPGPVAILPISNFGLQGIDPATCRLDQNGSIAPCLGPNPIDPRLGYQIVNGTRGPLNIKLGSDATVELRTHVMVSRSEPSEGQMPAAQVPCPVGDTWWWDVGSPQCFSGEPSRAPAPQQRLVPFVRELRHLGGASCLTGADCLILGPGKSLSVQALAHPFSDIPSMHGIAAVLPFLAPETFVDVWNRRVFGYYGTVLGSVSIGWNGAAYYDLNRLQYRYQEVSASVDTVARNERGLMVESAFEGQPERSTISTHPMTFLWQQSEPPPVF